MKVFGKDKVKSRCVLFDFIGHSKYEIIRIIEQTKTRYEGISTRKISTCYRVQTSIQSIIKTYPQKFERKSEAEILFWEIKRGQK